MVKIYESPDGGKTVYERDTKTGKRICIEKPKYPDYHLEDWEFREILELAKEGNKALRNSLKDVKLIYKIVKEPYEEWYE